MLERSPADRTSVLPYARVRRSRVDTLVSPWLGHVQRHVWLLSLLVALPFAWSCSCSDEPLVELDSIVNAPDSIDFGRVPVGERIEREVSLSSTGTGTVRIAGARIEGDASSVFSLSEVGFPIEISPGRDFALVVSFAPGAADSFEARLEIESPDTDTGLSIALIGIGIAPRVVLCTADPCDPEAEQPSLNLGGVSPGATTTGTLRIENRGQAMLRIERIDLDPTGLAEGFRILADLDRAVVPPGGGIDLPLALLGFEQGEVEALLMVATNDPQSPVSGADLRGEGVIAAPPRACAAVLGLQHRDGSRTLGEAAREARARPGDRVLLTAHPEPDCSAAEGARSLAYRWTLVESPAVSGSRITNSSSGPAPGSAEIPPSFDVDAAGIYRIELVVDDGLRASGPALLEVDARPMDDLTLELTWTVPADLDIHLVAPGGAPFCSPLDCFWDTCIGASGEGIPLLDWGPDTTGDGRLEPDGELATNPVLIFDNEGDRVVDEETGVRIETIRLELAPTVGGGRYLAGVHYFADRGVTAESFSAQLRLYRRGEEVLLVERVLQTEESGWWWEAIVIDSETFDASPGEAYEPMPGYVAPAPCP